MGKDEKGCFNLLSMYYFYHWNDNGYVFNARTYYCQEISMKNLAREREKRWVVQAQP